MDVSLHTDKVSHYPRIYPDIGKSKSSILFFYKGVLSIQGSGEF